MGKAIYDWVKIKDDFFKSEILEATAYIREIMGKEAKDDTNAANHIKGWTEDKRNWKREFMEKAEKKAEDEMIKKNKVGLESLLKSKRLSYDLMSNYLSCYGKMLVGQDLTKAEKDFIEKINIKGGIDIINKWLFIELGLPTNITQLQGSKEQPLFIVNILKEADEILKRKKRKC